MSFPDALKAFEARVASLDPTKPVHNFPGEYSIVVDALGSYLGKHRHSKPLPDDWDGCKERVMDITFGHNSAFFDASKIRENLDDLKTTSKEASGGKSDVMLEVPAWKVFEMVTAITALATIIRQREESSLRKAA